MTDPTFDPALLERIRTEREVRIETRAAGADADVHRTIIWVVVDEAGRVLVRSYRGPDARWYREATSGGPVALLVDGERVAVDVEHVTDEERISSCSAELARKYAGDPATPAMLRPEVLDTTLELRAV